MNSSYGRDLDLNLLRTLVVVVEEGAVTRAASRLYVTQPAVSAALARLRRAVGEPLFVRQGRFLAPTARCLRIIETARPSLRALSESVTDTATFVPATSPRVFRVGLADMIEALLMPQLLDHLGRVAPHVKLVVVPVQFRTVFDALAARRVDIAVTVADEGPRSILREEVFRGRFVCLHDPRRSRLAARPSLRGYLEQAHVVVSYNGDLRGIVEDLLGIERRVVCSVQGFAGLGAIVAGSALVATVPEVFARRMMALFPRLRMAPLPFTLPSSPIELLWHGSEDHEPAQVWLRQQLRTLARTLKSRRRSS